MTEPANVNERVITGLVCIGHSKHSARALMTQFPPAIVDQLAAQLDPVNGLPNKEFLTLARKAVAVIVRKRGQPQKTEQP